MTVVREPPAVWEPTIPDSFDGELRIPLPDEFEVSPLSLPLSIVQEKMVEWIEGGVRLGWLIDPFVRKVWIYRADGEVVELNDPSELSGEDVCSGLVIDMSQVWE